MDSGQQIPGTTFTVGDIVTLLNSAENCQEWKDAAGLNGENVKGVAIKDLAGKGFTAVIHRITFTFANSKRLFRVVLKCPSLAIMNKARPNDNEEKCAYLASLMANGHRREVFFFTEIAEPYLKGLDFIPRIFAWKESPQGIDKLDGTFLLMEDASVHSAHNEPEEKSFSKEQIESTIEALAKLHTHSLKMPPALIEQQYQLAHSQSNEDMKQIFAAENVFNGVVALPDPFGEYFRRHSASLRKFLERTEPGGLLFNYKMAQKYKFSPKIITHFDIWTNNLLFKKGEDGTAGDQLGSLLDWQLSHPGTGVNDLVRLILYNVDAELRQSNEANWIALYHAKFAEAAKAFDVTIPENFPLLSLDTVKELYRVHFPADLYTLMGVQTFFGHQSEHDDFEHGALRKSAERRMVAAFEQIRAEYE